MRAFVNGLPVDLLPGMTVRHALVAAGMLDELRSGMQPYDEWGNLIGLNGAVSEGMKIFVR
jgi:hypothetical protein